MESTHKALDYVINVLVVIPEASGRICIRRLNIKLHFGSAVK